MKNFLSALMFLSFFQTPFASGSDIELGIPGHGGTGCPAGSASVTLSPDSKAISIIFDEFIVEAGGNSGKTVARKNCNLAIPIKVPGGFSVSIVDIDYRGYVSLPSRSEARFTAEYFFAGQRGPVYQKRFVGQTDEDFLLSNRLGLQANIWSPCGQSVNLRVNASMLVRTNSQRADSIAMVDSADVSAGLVYHFKYRRCGGEYEEDDNGFSDGWN